ncbi:MAG: YebC/PmpR family DNA-binding transcriptional regulator [Halobacteriovoraceae bacterium]|nr:YebC/PmpR family DNA-binding transcriptional regulator [Halobacteriovoraceae bacterium]
MAGHSKWKNIQHRKGAQDIKRGKIFSKLIKEIMVAVKVGGGDMEGNPRLRLAIQNAKGANMPKDTIERAIKKASGVGADNLVETTFEGYGPSGEAVFIECTTDNNTRTVSSVRSCFNKYGGSLGKAGCLQFIFERKGMFTLNKGSLDEDEFTMELIDVGAEEVDFVEDEVEIVCAMEDFGNIQKFLGDKNIAARESRLSRIPVTTKKLDENSFARFLKLLDAIEENDDVQKVYHNVEYDQNLVDKLS